jgi:iron complex transport system substrate-binding protein
VFYLNFKQIEVIMKKIPLSIVFLILLSFLLSSCSPEAAPANSAIQITDGLGRQVSLPALPARIISLAPSNTEILFALGAGDRLVGRDDFSDYPAEAKKIPSIGGIEKFSMEQITSLKPDLILAAGITSPEQIKALEDLNLKVYAVANPTNLDGLYTNLNAVGKLVGKEKEAGALSATLKQRFETVQKAVATTSNRPKAFYELDGTDPTKPWTAGKGTFIDLLIQTAGGVNIGNAIQGDWGQISQEQLIVENPDVVIMGDLTYGITMEQVLARPGWQTLKAIKDKKVYPFEDNLVSRPGPRMIDGLVELVKILHPEVASQVK